MKTRNILILVMALLMLGACAHSIDVSACVNAEPYGFWHGLWHGIIAPIHLIIMLFSDEYVVFSPNNNGFWYSFGFVLGSGGWGFLGSKGAKKSKC